MVHLTKLSQKQLYYVVYLPDIMSQDSVSIKTIADVCGSAGIQLRDVTKIEDDVYTGALVEKEWNGSRQLFVKLHPKARKSEFERFAQIATDVGHPPCRIINGDEWLYVAMAQADGRPLSQLMPIMLIPGVWQVSKQRLKRVYYQLGSYLGTLHTKTKKGMRPLLTNNEQNNIYKSVKAIDHLFAPDELLKIEQIIEFGDTFKTTHAITYGDRSPHNIYYDGNQTTLIDVNCTCQSIMTDHTSVLLGVRLMIQRLPYACQEAVNSIETSYWRGYKRTGMFESINNEALICHYIVNIIEILHRYELKSHTLIQKILKYVDTRTLVNELTRVYSKKSMTYE